MSILGKTMNIWLRFRIIQLGIIFILFASLLILYSPITTQPQILVVEFIIEIIAVFVGLIFGFYYNISHEKLVEESEYIQLINDIKNELQYNQTSLNDKYSTLITDMWTSGINAGIIRLLKKHQKTELSILYHKMYKYNNLANKATELEGATSGKGRDLTVGSRDNINRAHLIDITKKLDSLNKELKEIIDANLIKNNFWI